jgi:hypothetical protein
MRIIGQKRAACGTAPGQGGPCIRSPAERAIDLNGESAERGCSTVALLGGIFWEQARKVDDLSLAVARHIWQ